MWNYSHHPRPEQVPPFKSGGSIGLAIKQEKQQSNTIWTTAMTIECSTSWTSQITCENDKHGASSHHNCTPWIVLSGLRYHLLDQNRAPWSSLEKPWLTGTQYRLSHNLIQKLNDSIKTQLFFLGKSMSQPILSPHQHSSSHWACSVPTISHITLHNTPLI